MTSQCVWKFLWWKLWKGFESGVQHLLVVPSKCSSVCICVFFWMRCHNLCRHFKVFPIIQSISVNFPACYVKKFFTAKCSSFGVRVFMCEFFVSYLRWLHIPEWLILPDCLRKLSRWFWRFDGNGEHVFLLLHVVLMLVLDLFAFDFVP